MNRKILPYIALVVVIVGLLIYADASSPKPVDWSPTYATKDKIPFGLYVLDQEAPQLFKGDSIQKFRTTPYEFFDGLYDYDNEQYKTSGTYIAINEESDIDSESVTELLNFADYGNTVMLSMKYFPQTITDTLGLVMGNQFFSDSIAINLAKTPAKKYWLNEGAGVMYFDSISPERVTAGGIKILGYQYIKGKKYPDFVEVPFGNGRILLHTQPAAFTNYYLLKKDHYNYIQGLVSAIPKGTIFWQNGTAGDGVSGSPLRYIFSQPALKAAY